MGPPNITHTAKSFLDGGLENPLKFPDGMQNPSKSQHQLPKTETFCDSIFKRMGPVNFRNYVTIKKIEEKNLPLRNQAAIKIQAAWRGFFIRINAENLVASAIIIQAAIRGFLARRRVDKLKKDRYKRICEHFMNEAAKVIQAGWRGYWSRKTKFSFASYQQLQKKNEELKKSIEQINELERALLKSAEQIKQSKRTSKHDRKSLTRKDSDGKRQSVWKRKSFSKSSRSSQSASETRNNTETSVPEIQDMIVENIASLAEKMDQARVTELYAYALNKTINATKTAETPERSDSIDQLFPKVPTDVENAQVIIPDLNKVEALKEAIRLLKIESKSQEKKKLERLHFLLRTSAQPGVYSHIYCRELTDFEKRLKDLRFWTPPPDPRKPPRRSTYTKDNIQKKSNFRISSLSYPAGLFDDADNLDPEVIFGISEQVID